MKEKPIIFSAPMVCAIRDGRKTQTRRLVYPKSGGKIKGPAGPAAAMEYLGIDNDGRACFRTVQCPYGPLGTRLLVRDASRPRWDSQVEVDVIDVRIGKLQDISEADTIAEGLAAKSKDGGRTIKYGIPDRDGLPGNDDIGWNWKDWEADPRQAYRRLWEQIYGLGSWDANPWVWVIDFRRLEGDEA